MPSGGRRTGTPGVAYGNRTDLNERQFVGQTYGTAAAQRERTEAISPTGAPGPVRARDVIPRNAPKPGSLGPLTAPSERRDEPVTAGAALGPGPGLEALGLNPQDKLRQDDYRALSAYLPVLNFMAQHRATPSTVAFLRQIYLGAPSGRVG